MSLEVGEHIWKEGEQAFLDNVRRHAQRGIVLSWAISGQNGGHNHVNEQPNAYIIEQLKIRGCTYDEQASTQLREVATLPWFKNTIMVFTC